MHRINRYVVAQLAVSNPEHLQTMSETEHASSEAVSAVAGRDTVGIS